MIKNSTFWTVITAIILISLFCLADIQVAVMSSAVLFTVFIVLSLYHLMVFGLNRSNKLALFFASFNFFAGVFIFTNSPAIVFFLTNAEYVSRLDWLSLFFLLCSAAALLENLNYNGLNKPTRVGFVIGVLTAAGIFFTPVRFGYHLSLVMRLITGCFLLYIFLYDVCRAMAVQIKERRDSESAWGMTNGFGKLFFMTLADRDSGSFFMLSSVVLLVCAPDIPLDGIRYSRWALLGFSLCMTYLLARRHMQHYRATAEMNAMLEGIVNERTTLLDEQILIAEAASRSKGDFLANMSHEIRTPLNAVLGMTTIGLNADSLEQKNYSFKKILEASSHLLNLINDILDMSKIEAGKLELSETAFRLRETVSRVADVMRFKTNEKEQALELLFEDGLPEAVVCDELRLAQVLTNLIGNAVKFTPNGGRVTVKVYNDGDSLRFLVTDTGIGITEEQQSKLFRSFQQAESSTTRKYGGTGLGLALSRQIVELMGGNIWVESEPNQGSTFGFTVRAARTEAADAEEAADSAAFEILPGEFKDKVIMMAEDVEINREILMTLLEASEAELVFAENGEEACGLFDESPERFDLILMDVQMPVMDGYDASRKIRARGGTLPIVAMTANVFKEDVDRCIEAGMNAHLGKPIEINKLLTTLRKYLTGDQSGQRAPT